MKSAPSREGDPGQQETSKAALDRERGHRGHFPGFPAGGTVVQTQADRYGWVCLHSHQGSSVMEGVVPRCLTKEGGSWACGVVLRDATPLLPDPVAFTGLLPHALPSLLSTPGDVTLATKPTPCYSDFQTLGLRAK